MKLDMKNSSGISSQLVVALVILLAGGGFLGGEYFLVKWYPRHQLHVTQETLKLLPYRNDGLGVEMQIATGLYGKVESFPNSIRIYRPRLWGAEPSLTVSPQPNPDHAAEFSPQIAAIWETDGVQKGIRRYHFERTQIENRDAVLIWQPNKDHVMTLTARIIAPDRIMVAECSVGGDDEALFIQACEDTVRTMKVAGPEAPPKAPGGIEEIPGIVR